MVSTGSSKISPFIKYDYQLGDVMAMPFPDDSFDTVIDTFGLEYVLNPHKALSEMRRYPPPHPESAKKTEEFC
jgi:ubiquinone/menaquinone biosynthesis C-methylase UbiE